MTRLDVKLLGALLGAIFLGLGLVWVGQAFAYTCTAAGGCTFEIDYTEPASLTNAQPITDLTSCTVTYAIATDGGAAGSLKTLAVPATKPGGGGAVVKTVAEPSLTPPHTYTVVSPTVACTSTAFGTGLPLTGTPLVMNSGVAPNTPSGITVK